MKRILLLGAGKSATCLIDYLVKELKKNDWQLTLCDADLALAKSKIKSAENTDAVSINVEDEHSRKKLVQSADIVISMLPPALHFLIAKDCVQFGKNLLTASYVDENIKSLEKQIADKNLLFLCEMGLDPGIDHMSAMKMINSIKAQGGVINSFISHWGGLHGRIAGSLWEQDFRLDLQAGLGRLIFQSRHDGAHQRKIRIDDRDLGRRLLLGDKLGDGIAPARRVGFNAERIARARLGQLRKGGDRDDERHFVLLGIAVHGESSIGACRSAERDHLTLDIQIARGGECLVRSRLIIDGDEFDLAFACRVDLQLGKLKAGDTTRAEKRPRPRKFRDESDLYRFLGESRRAQNKSKCKARCEYSTLSFHCHSLPIFCCEFTIRV